MAGGRRPQERGGVKKCPVLENPGQKFRLWQRKPWAQKRTDLLPKALEMTNFSEGIQQIVCPIFRKPASMTNGTGYDGIAIT